MHASLDRSSLPSPRWLVPLGVASLLWNSFGVVQFLVSLRDTPESLIRMGMAPEQAQVVGNYPTWMHAAFALGVFAGLVGSLLLVAQRRLARALFAVSLAGYVALYVGDITEGVFAALGLGQVAILSLVVSIAVALFALALRLERERVLA